MSRTAKIFIGITAIAIGAFLALWLRQRPFEPHANNVDASRSQFSETRSAVAPAAPVLRYDTVTEAYHAALRDARAADRVAVFGSFYTVAQTLPGAL